MRQICNSPDCDDNTSFEIRLLTNGRIILTCDRCGRRYEIVRRPKTRMIDIKESKE